MQSDKSNAFSLKSITEEEKRRLKAVLFDKIMIAAQENDTWVLSITVRAAIKVYDEFLTKT